MSDAFISYSRKDIAFAKLLHEALKENDVETWIDWQDIPPSAEWLDEVYEAIEKSDTFVFIISETSLDSEICGFEIAHAVKHNKRLIPIVIQDIEAGKVPKELAVLNWIFFEEAGEKFSAAIDDLITAIAVDQAWVKSHTRFEIRALYLHRKEQDRGLLLRSSDLAEAETWLSKAAEKDPLPTALQTQFILKSRADSTRRQRITLGAVGLGFIVSVALGIFAWGQRNVAVSEGFAKATAQAEAEAESLMRATQQAIAVEQRDIAEEQTIIALHEATIARSRELAAQSVSIRDIDFSLSLLLGIEAHRTFETIQARGALLDNAGSHPQLLQYLATNLVDLMSVTFSPDNKTVASGSCGEEDAQGSCGLGQIMLWDVETDWVETTARYGIVRVRPAL